MKFNLKGIITSRILALSLLIVYAVLLAVATFIESKFSTQTAKDVIYHAGWFIALQGFMVVNLFGVLISGDYFKRKRWGVIVTHLSFVVILIGALVTHITGREGILHIREGESNSTMVVQGEGRQEIVNLPFKVELKDFTLKRYPGSSSPSSYESLIVVHANGESREEHIYMNNTLDVMGHRLFQASYDKDEKGTVLLVNQDVVGRTITYAGYILLVLGFVISLFIRNGRIVALYTRLSKLNKAGMIAIAVMGATLLLPQNLQAQITGDESLEIIHRHIVPEEYADKFGAMPMQDSRGRITPINTFASEITRKLHKEEKIADLTPEQFILSLWLMPEVWMHVPFIEYDDAAAQHKYNLPKDYFAYMDIFDEEGNYIFQKELDDIYAKGANDRSKSDKELLKIDEKVNIVNQLFNYRMVRLFPDDKDPNHAWYSPGDDLSAFEGQDSMFVSKIFNWYLSEVGRSVTNADNWGEADRVLGMISTFQTAKDVGKNINMEKVEAELKYNKKGIFAKCKRYYLILGGLLLIVSLFEIMNRRRWVKYAKMGLWILTLGTFHYHMYGMGLRWFIGGYAPWSNSYETMVYISWVAAVTGILFAKRATFVFAISTLFAGVVLFVSGLNWMDPEITPLVPVLRSPWLMFHVAVIVAAYGLFGICFLLGVTNLILMIIRGDKQNERLDKGISELTIINEIALWFGLILLAIGIFLGAVWANESWGRYWGWDPKETWALITMLLYAVVAHLYLIKGIYTKFNFNFLSVMAFLSVIMTYFGVNLFLSGMHSYNTSSLSSEALIYIFVVVGALIGLGCVAKLKYKNE